MEEITHQAPAIRKADTILKAAAREEDDAILLAPFFFEAPEILALTGPKCLDQPMGWHAHA